MNWSITRRIAPLAVLAAATLALPPLSAEPALSFTPIWVPRSGEIPKEARQKALDGLAAQQSDPQHIAVLIHGFDTPVYASDKQYNQVAPVVKAQFDKLHERVAVLGVQWDSNVGPQREWLPAEFGSVMVGFVGLKKVIRDPYTSRIPIARTMGRVGLREMLFDVQERFPNAHIHLMAHSMGAEAAAHAINPEFTPIKKDTPIYQPERPLKLDVVALAGADLDFDAGAKSKPVNPAAAPRLIWVTLPKLGASRDKVLDLRKRVRSKAAVGNAVPRFRQDQYDALVSTRRLVFDTLDIPNNHALVDYWKEGRVSRIAAAAAGIRDPEHNPSELLKTCEAVLAAPAEVSKITPFLIGPETAPKIYALWRLEHILDGSCAHLSDGYDERVLSETLENPNWLTEERARTECRVVKNGLWPPADVVALSRKRYQKKHDKDDEEAHQQFFTQPVVGTLDKVR